MGVYFCSDCDFSTNLIELIHEHLTQVHRKLSIKEIEKAIEDAWEKSR